METILVSIISDQTIPNLLIIKELANQYQSQVFISTNKMEEAEKSFWIEKAAGIEPGSVARIIVNENNWNDIKTKLENYEWPENTKFIVNLTGGTKVMTLAVYEYFAKPGNRIVYAVIGKNQFEELYPERDKEPVFIKYRLSLKEYLNVHGLYFKSDSHFIYPKEHTIEFFKEFRKNNFNFGEQAEIRDAHQMFEKQDKAYYSGFWFEEFTYHILATKLNLKNNEIAANVKLYRNPGDVWHDNEYDVVFTMNNALYVIECKVSLGNEKTLKAKLEKSLYKLGAITRDFGLRVNSYIFTLSSVGKVGEMSELVLNKRKDILGIKEIFDSRDFTDINQIINQIKK